MPFRYNAMSHPLPFMKATSILAPKSKAKEMPDLEEAIEEEDDLVEAPDVDEDDETDLKKDKYIKQPKAKAAGKKAAPAKKAKAKVADDDEDDEDVKPKAKPKPRGRPAKK